MPQHQMDSNDNTHTNDKEGGSIESQPDMNAEESNEEHLESPYRNMTESSPEISRTD